MPYYIDVNGDGICDLSRATAATSTSTPTDTTNSDTSSSTSSGDPQSAGNSDQVASNGASLDPAVLTRTTVPMLVPWEILDQAWTAVSLWMEEVTMFYQSVFCY